MKKLIRFYGYLSSSFNLLNLLYPKLKKIKSPRVIRDFLGHMKHILDLFNSLSIILCSDKAKDLSKYMKYIRLA